MKAASHRSAIDSLRSRAEDEVLARFKSIDPSPSPAIGNVKHALGEMFRGATLMKHSLEWKNPQVGGGGKLDSIRGLQWRLVMAYSGYEQIENAIFGKNCHKKKSRKEALSKIWIKHRLPGPVLTQRALDHIEVRDKEAGELCDFLGIQKNKRDRFTDWLLGRTDDEPCGTERAVFICAQLRHLVAHGALSADRAKQLGLETAFEAAPLVLHEIAGGLLEILIHNQPTIKP